MRRRSFLACAMAAPLVGQAAMAQTNAALAIPARKLERLCLSTSSYRANYDGWRFADPAVLPRLSHLIFPRYVKERFGLTKVELWDQQFGPSGAAGAAAATPEFCRQIKAAADDVGVSIVSIEVESTPPMDQLDAAARDQTVDACKAWLDKARILGAQSIRVNVNKTKGVVNMDAAVDTLRRVAAYGRSIGVRVLLENHGGYTSDPHNLAAMVKAVGDDFCRAEVDWGEWSAPGDRYDDLQSAMPYAHIVSAKGLTFDEATYQHTDYDVGRIVRKAEVGGFKGVYSIELWNTPAPRDTDRAVRSFMTSISQNMA